MTKLEHALALAAKGFWIFPITAGRKSPPRMTGWQEWATRDTAKLEAWWKTNPDDNIGIFTGKFGDDGAAVLAVDVDNKGGKDGDGDFLKLEDAGHHFPETFENRTPTGGWHLVYRCDRPVKQSVGDVAPAIDIRSKGGFIVGPGSTVASGDYDGSGEVQDAPAWLVDRCGQPRERAVGNEQSGTPAPSGVDRARHYLLNEAPLANEGDAGDQTTFKVAAKVKDFGLTQAEAVCAMLSHWNDRCSPPWDLDELDAKAANAYKYGLDPVGVAAPENAFSPVAQPAGEPSAPAEASHPFEILNREYAFVVAGGGSHILHETRDAYDRAEVKHLDKGTFNDKFASWEMQCGKKSAAVTKLWMCSPSRRSYDGIVFDPQRGGDVTAGPRKYFNLWRGFAYEPLAANETPSHEAQHAVDSFFEHARANVCRGDDKLYGWLIGYFAHLVQRPWEKPLTALVFKGGKGVGKNALVERVGNLLGGHFLLTSNRRYLTGNFNGHLENCLMFALDEAFWSGDKSAEGVIKDLITGTDHVIEHKNKEPFRVANRTRVVIIGNEEWLVPSSHDERRFAVFDVGAGRQQDRTYFERMRLGMESGGYRLLLRQLLCAPLSDVNDAPKTQALHDQKVKSLDSFGKWWLDCLHEGRIVSSDFEAPWPTQAECDRFRNAYRRHARESGHGRFMMSDTEVGKALKKVCAGAHGSKKRSGSDFINTYKLPELAGARQSWEEYIGHPVEWPAE